MPVERGLRLSLTFIAVGAIASVVLLARVAVDDDGGAEATQRAQPGITTQPSWIAAAGEECQRAIEKRARRTRRFLRRAGPEPTPGQRVWLVRRVVVPSIQRLTNSLAAIPALPEEKRDARRLVRALRGGVRTLEGNPWLAVTGEAPKDVLKAARIARGLGIENCAR